MMRGVVSSGFNATSRSSLVSRARYTSPMPLADEGGDVVMAEAGADCQSHDDADASF